MSFLFHFTTLRDVRERVICAPIVQHHGMCYGICHPDTLVFLSGLRCQLLFIMIPCTGQNNSYHVGCPTFV